MVVCLVLMRFDVMATVLFSRLDLILHFIVVNALLEFILAVLFGS